MKKGRLYNDHGSVSNVCHGFSTLKALIDCSLAGGRALLKMPWVENVGHRRTSDHSFKTATLVYLPLLSVGHLDTLERFPYLVPPNEKPRNLISGQISSCRNPTAQCRLSPHDSPRRSARWSLLAAHCGHDEWRSTVPQFVKYDTKY